MLTAGWRQHKLTNMEPRRETAGGVTGHEPDVGLRAIATLMEPALGIAEGAASNDPDIGLRAIAALRALTERLEILQVQSARERGWSWQDIAQRLGVSKQTVHRKYGRRIGGR